MLYGAMIMARDAALRGAEKLPMWRWCFGREIDFEMCRYIVISFWKHFSHASCVESVCLCGIP